VRITGLLFFFVSFGKRAPLLRNRTIAIVYALLKKAGRLSRYKEKPPTEVRGKSLSVPFPANGILPLTFDISFQSK